MSDIVLLDSGPLGLITHPFGSPEADACEQWLNDLPKSGRLALLPEIIDYETRREMLRRRNVDALRKLDTLKNSGRYLPLTTEAMLQAAQFWATAQQQGIPTANRLALDADVILAAQAATLDPAAWGMPGAGVIVATVNVGHLGRFVDARTWQTI